MKTKEINFSKIEKKWQKAWEKKKVFEVKEDIKKKKFYVVEMYPYPSASGLHMGHAFNYVIGDIYARYKGMNGFHVLHPMGFDSFGLPAENAAIKAKSHPKIFTNKAIKSFVKQQKALGLSYAWERRIQSHDPNYYKWNQYLFLKFYEKGLVYRKEAPVNWCGKCNTVLANEQVQGGKCWRHSDTEVEIRNLEQWFIKTTEYAEELLRGIDKLDWPERIKIMQRNWIGRSEGTEIIFKINGKNWRIFTTRPDTLYGVTFMVVSAQHPRLMEIVTNEQREKVEKFVKRIRTTKKEDIDKLEKEGIFTGSYAVHPFTNEKIPIWTGNFVLADYGSGMVMAVPAHDQRDFEFAKKYKIPVKVVIAPEKDISKLKGGAYESPGILINSNEFNGLFSEEAKEHITKALEIKKLGRKIVNYKLRDWLISRQRYWGTPIPIIYCENCGIVPVPEKELPILLPDKVKFGIGNPLETDRNFVEVKCPKCKENAKRETDTMDTFFDSSWYYLRYTDARNKKEPFDSKKSNYWMPVDFYIGGAEHAILHLIYARFFSKALRDMEYVNYDEPFTRLFNQGMIHGEDGYVMSKSRGNVVDPLEISEKYGADALRLFLVSASSPDKDSMWSSIGIESMSKFVKRLYEVVKNMKIGESSKRFQSKLNTIIKKVTEEIEYVRYNIAIINIRELIQKLEQEHTIEKKDLEMIIKLISPFMPHIAEELWNNLKNKGFVSLAEWPKYDESKIDLNLEKIEKDIDNAVLDIFNIIKIVKEKQRKEAKRIYLYSVPDEVENYNAIELTKRIGKEVNVFAVNDKNKYDPEGKSSKAKPGKPGIYVE